MSAAWVPITWLRSTAVSRVGLVDDRLHVGARGDTEVLGDPGRAAGPLHVAAGDHQLQHRVAGTGVDALGDQDVPDHQVGHPVGVPGDDGVDRGVLSASAMPTIGRPTERPACRRRRWRPFAVPSWITTICTSTPARAQPLGLRGDPLAGGRNVSPSVAPADTSSGVFSSAGADHADLDAVDA